MCQKCEYLGVILLFFFIWLGSGVILFFLYAYRLSGSNKNLIRFLPLILPIAFAYFYLSYISLLGNWSIWLASILIAITIFWPFKAIHSWFRGPTTISRLLPLLVLVSIPVIVWACSDDFARLFGFRISFVSYPEIIIFLFLLTILSKIK